MIKTERLILRGWREGDIEPFYAMGQDAEVMRYIGPPTTRRNARTVYERMVAHQAERGHCFWAVERKLDAAFIGFCGLLPAKPPLEGEVEIGWRLARAAWGQGYAREGAEASLSWAWAKLPAPSIAAITVPANTRSRGLMERLGMTRYPNEDFAHPDLAKDDPLSRHILYRIMRPA